MYEQKTLHLVFVLFLFQFICPGLLQADESKPSQWSIDTPQKGQGEYVNPAEGKLIFYIPSSWRSKLTRTVQQKYEVLVFAPQSGNSFKMLLDPLIKKREMIDFNDMDMVRRQVERLGSQFINFAVEEKVTLQSLQGSDSTGYYFSITDKKQVKPFEWQCLTQGRIAVGTFYLHFTIFSQTLDAQEINEALGMLATIKYSKIE